MNYIKKLERELETKKAQLKAFEDGLQSLYGYLNSPKFQGIENNFVNPADIFLRLRETETQVSEIERFYRAIPFSLAEIKKAFNKVQNPSDWKAPISATIKENEREVMAEAIKFYTATEAHFRPAGPGLLSVYAKGYRLGPAGDH